MPTQLEKSIIQERRNKHNVILPLLHELMKRPLNIDSELDAQFLFQLSMRSVERERMRKEGTGVYSPSSLAKCIRKVYLSKNWQELGLERVELPALEPHYYFLTGDFIHLKWQFAFWRLAQVCDGFDLIDDGLPYPLASGFEIPVLSKRGDHGGTIDIACILLGEPLLIDVKGVNVRTFQKAVRGEPPAEYTMQTTDYAMLANMPRGGLNLPRKVERAVILFENKGGPDMNHPIALHEHIVNVPQHVPEIKARIETLRSYETKKEIPPVECTNTKTIQFQGCPFAGICKKEVRKIERRNAANSDTKRLELAKPSRTDRSRRPRSK